MWRPNKYWTCSTMRPNPPTLYGSQPNPATTRSGPHLPQQLAAVEVVPSRRGRPVMTFLQDPVSVEAPPTCDISPVIRPGCHTSINSRLR